MKLKDGDAQSVIQPRDASYSHVEQDLVTSLLVVTGQEQKAIYFLSGHGERSANNTGSGRLQRDAHWPGTGQLSRGDPAVGPQ